MGGFKSLLLAPAIRVVCINNWSRMTLVQFIFLVTATKKVDGVGTARRDTTIKRGT